MKWWVKMALKVKNEIPAPPKAIAKAKDLKTKKAVLRGIHSHKKKIHFSPIFPEAQDHEAPEAAQIPWKEGPGETSLSTMLSSSSPTRSAMKKTEDNITLCLLWISRPTSTSLSRLWRNSMTLMWPSQYPHKAWWREGDLCLAGFWLWGSGCCQENWDHLSPAG